MADIHLGAPQLVYLAIVMFGMGVTLAKFGQRKTDSYDLTDLLVAPALGLALLWWGGFFSG
jgi:hypothetical protein